MELQANYIRRIEIHGLWNRYDVAWDLRPDVNVLSGIIILCVVCLFLAEYIKKRRFYREFRNILDELDQKYLITEMMLQPDFEEGKIWMEALYEIDRSMMERINKMETTVRDFKEYLELWIHEIKVPIAALKLMNYNGNTDAKKQKFTLKFRWLYTLTENRSFYRNHWKCK